MPNILIVDDSAVDRTLAGKLLESEEGARISFAKNGREALEQIEVKRPDVVVSDLQMPEVDGLELVAEVRERHPSIPVILMTARGSEEIAAEAIKVGAAGFVPKVSLGTNLRLAVRQIFDASELDQLNSRLFHSLQNASFHFRLEDDPTLIAPLAEHIQETLRCMPLGEATERIRVAMSVGQALWIAHYHGNLEISLDERWGDDEFNENVAALYDSSERVPRTIELHTTISPDTASFRISYDGPPINLDALPEDLTKVTAERSWLAGFVMIPVVMDEVVWDGSTINLVKRAVEPPEEQLELG